MNVIHFCNSMFPKKMVLKWPKLSVKAVTKVSINTKVLIMSLLINSHEKISKIFINKFVFDM